MISKELFKQVFTEQRTTFLKKETGIRRNAIESVKSRLHLPHVHVVTGLRRCGKSTLLRQIASELFNDQNFYYINFEDERLLSFEAVRFNEVYETLVELFGECKTFFIDEIQHVKDFDSFVRRFYESGFKFFITGSNAGLLKDEISSRLTGRHIDTYLTPFTFREFLDYHHIDISPEFLYLSERRAQLKRLFNEFMSRGGMPEYVIYEDPEILRRIYDDIVVKDIFIRNKVEHPFQGKELYQYLISNFAQRFSYNSLLKTISLGSVNTVKKYIQYLEDTYLISLANKFDFSVSKQIANDKKLYVCDNGFIQVLSTRPGSDRGWLLENLVRNQLPSGLDVFYFSRGRECDFVLINSKTIQSALQVCWEMDQTNMDREVKGLLEAMEYFRLDEGLLLTYDQEEVKVFNQKRITVKPVWKWLLEERESG